MFTQSKIGNTIIKQKKGCPIGGILSGSYANIYCAKNEYEFLKRQEEIIDIRRIQGIRQMDDLILWIAYNEESNLSKKQTADILEELYNTETEQTKVYKGGLNLEMQTIKYNKKKKSFKMDFAGTRIHGTTNAKELYTRTLNKNIKHIRKHGIQKYTRYPNKETYIHDNIKRGVIIGNIVRTEKQNTYERDLKRAIKEDIEELECIGYREEEIKHTLNRLKKRKGWRKLLEEIWDERNRKMGHEHKSRPHMKSSRKPEREKQRRKTGNDNA
jgi:hypothetical protein